MADDILNDPHKIFYSIGEVSQLTGLKSHILRYWESEFPTLRPEKRSNGRRAYRKTDILLILAIKKLLYAEGYTIAGARKKLAEARRRPQGEKKLLAEVREDLQELRGLLSMRQKRAG